MKKYRFLVEYLLLPTLFGCLLLYYSFLHYDTIKYSNETIFADMYYIGSGVLSLSLTMIIICIVFKINTFSDFKKINQLKHYSNYYKIFNLSWWLLIPFDYIHCYISSLRHDNPSYFDISNKYSIYNYFWLIIGGVILNIIIKKNSRIPYSNGKLTSIKYNSSSTWSISLILFLLCVYLIFSVVFGDFLSVPILSILILLFFSLRSRIVCCFNSNN